VDLVGGIAAWTICASLLALTVACQRPRWKWLTSLKYHDVAAVIPAWTFFAPNPGTNDCRLLWRELRCDGTVSVWHEVSPPGAGVLRALWNPRKREGKVISDAGPMLLRMIASNPTSTMSLVSVPYLLVLNRISAEPVSPMTVARQFLMLHTTGTDADTGQFSPLILSRWHAVGECSSQQIVEAQARNPSAGSRLSAGASAEVTG
jgi:hypothetical protein